MGMNDFGRRLALARKEQGMTQEQLAARLGVTPQAVSKWERGNGYPDLDLLFSLCEIAKCSSDYLIGRDTISSNLTEDKDEKAATQLLRDVLAEPLTLETGTGFVGVLTKEYQEQFPVIRELRERMAKKYGFLLPVLRIRDNESLGELEYRILAYDRILYKSDLKSVTENTFREICDRLEETVLEHFDKIVNHQMIQLLVDNLTGKYPAAVNGVIPEKVSLSELQAVLSSLIRKRKPIRNLMKILEFLEESEATEDTDLMADRIIDTLKL